MSRQARSAAAYARRVIAALAFWLVAVLFVIDVSLLSGWLLSEGAAAATPAPAPVPVVAEESPASDPRPVAVALDGGAAITFPHPPAQSQEIVEVAGEEVVLVLYSATAEDETTYNVGVIEYPPAVDVSDPAVNLIGSASGAAGSAGARVATQLVTVYEGAPAVEFTLEADTTTVLARNVLVGRRLYTTNVAYAGEEPDDAAAFLDSLALPE